MEDSRDSEEEKKELVENTVDNSTNARSNIIEPTITKKDPKKVEQGRRLALISKAAKEKKMREKIEAEMKMENNTFFP